MKFYLTLVLCVWISLAVGIYSQVSGSNYETIGCFEDQDPDRAIETLEGKDDILDGDYKERTDPINKCYKAANRRGFLMFAVQNGGWCASSATAIDTYNKYGRSSDCDEDGEGGPFANQVYYITTVTESDYNTVGCYEDQDPDRAIETLEGEDDILDGDYKERADPINKCYQAAKSRGFKVFAVQNGGWCASSARAEYTFNQYGPSSDCDADGEGGPFANQVYFIITQLPCSNGGACLLIPIPGGGTICGGGCQCPGEYTGLQCKFRLEDPKMRMTYNSFGMTAAPACQYPGEPNLVSLSCPPER